MIAMHLRLLIITRDKHCHKHCHIVTNIVTNTVTNIVTHASSYSLYRVAVATILVHVWSDSMYTRTLTEENYVSEGNEILAQYLEQNTQKRLGTFGG